jgi:hypothetical protein
MDNLDAIAQEGAALEQKAGPAPGEVAAPPQPEQSPAEKWASLPELFGSIVTMAMPELKPAYSEKNCLAWGNAMVPLAAKYGWDVDKLLAYLGPWVGVAVASIPMAVPTVVAVKTRRAAIRAHREAEAKAKAEGKGPQPQPAPAP